MTFYDFLDQVNSQLPKTERTELFENLISKHSPSSPSFFAKPIPCVEFPIHLSDIEINCLIHILSENIIEIDYKGKLINAFLLFINMGTVIMNEKDNPDDFLGAKDERIETAIINAAKIKHAQQKERAQNQEIHQVNSAVFGLSGNPATDNHGNMIEHLQQETTYDYVHIVLNAQSPLKAKNSYVDSQIRYQMLQNMLEEKGIDFNKCQISRLEIDRAAPSRMVVTISAMILMSQNYENISLILGRDALALSDDNKPNFTHWYQWQAFSTLCCIKFYPRAGEELSLNDMAVAINTLKDQTVTFTTVYRRQYDTEQHNNQLAYLTELKSMVRSPFDVEIKALKTTAGSATEIREHYQQGKPGVPNGFTKKNDELVRELGLFVLPASNAPFLNQC